VSIVLLKGNAEFSLRAWLHHGVSLHMHPPHQQSKNKNQSRAHRTLLAA